MGPWERMYDLGDLINSVLKSTVALMKHVLDFCIY